MLNTIQIVPNILFKKAKILYELAYNLLVKHLKIAFASEKNRNGGHFEQLL